MNTRSNQWNPDLLTIKQPPSPREVYWIAAIDGSKAPEFTGFHPGIIIRGCKSLHEGSETVTFVPITSREPRRNDRGRYPAYIHELSENPNPNDDRKVWAVCSNLMTVRVSRLERFRTPNGPRIGKVSREDFNDVLDTVNAANGALRHRMNTVIQEELERERLKNSHILDATIAAMEANFESRLHEMARQIAETMIAEKEMADSSLEMRM